MNAPFASLNDLSRPELLTLWHRHYPNAPFKGARNTTLIRGISYSEQVRLHGGLKVSTKRKLLKIAKGLNSDLTSAPVGTGKPPPPKIQLGTQIVREWNGKTYTVLCTDQGFVMNGVTYGSLSSIAKAITGTNWSGPRFFGVRG
ncbi:MAG: DUF2924 domain-containing protein [Pseudomonadota bacterium]